ncbi:hypothetical protein SLS53_008700 [Cytospora paraplurivora]|uniref:ASX DEUBAD domain-containing protein n=1 Tax=Cytospora paraplurivora TaxID=2898453 RepID=A0AAN9TYH6_9PEZI
MAPITRRQSANVPANDDPEIDSKEAAEKRFGDIESSSNDDDKVVAEIHVSPKATRRRVPSKRGQLSSSKPTSSRQPAAKRPKTKINKWEPNYVTQNSKSPLVGRDLRALLLHPRAWDLLEEDDKKEVLALFPDNKHILDAGTPNARPNVASLQNDDNFRHDTEEYVSNLYRGMHDPAWLQDAWAAHGSRAAGNFDHYYVRKLEADWKTTIPDEMKPEHLRPAPPADQDSLDAGQPEEGAGAVNIETDAIMVSTEANWSAVTEDDAKGNDDMEVEQASNGFPKNNAEEGNLEIVVNGIETVSDAKDNDTNDGDADKMQTGYE